MPDAVQVESCSMFIGGEAVETGKTFEVSLPFDSSVVAEVQEADGATLDRAVASAREGAAAMAKLTLYDRAELLMRVHDLVRRDLGEFARLICLETGKPIREARVEAERSLQTLIASAHEARQLCGEVIPIEAAPVGKGRMAMTVREPVGVIGAITPFNVPMNLALHKVGPALAGGNAVVHKPAEKTPLSATRLAHLFAEAGAPKGAYNVVHGTGPELGPNMATHPGIDMLTFTGSVAVGRSLKTVAGLKKMTLELGNNSAAILEPDTDLDWAVGRCVAGAFANSGQVCISVQRIFVHESLASEFLERFKAGAEALKIGHPMEDSTEISSLITQAAAERVESWIREAVDAGGKVVTGGRRTGATISPTIVTGIADKVRLSCEEAFGPVAVVHVYRDLEDTIARVNQGPFGLQAGIFTRDIERAFRAAHALRYGGVMINDVPMYRADHMPYGGVKDSGTGREGPKYAIEEMTELKTIVWKV
ncbi:MAG: aldehyde dehydrogenase family protein [Bryobacteraceae bacterium]